MGCQVCDDAIASGTIRCHCPNERDGSQTRHHDHKWIGAGGTHLSCPVKLFEASHRHNAMTNDELKASLLLITKTDNVYDPEKTLAVRRGLLDTEGGK